MADERFKALTSMKDRKSAFEDFCRDVSEQQKRSKGTNGQAERHDSEEAKANFRSLMEEASKRTPDGEAPLIQFVLLASPGHTYPIGLKADGGSCLLPQV